MTFSDLGNLQGATNERDSLTTSLRWLAFIESRSRYADDESGLCNEVATAMPQAV